MNKRNIIHFIQWVLILVLQGSYYSGLSQNQQTNVEEEAENQNLRLQVNQWVNQFSDVQLFDNSIQVRHQGKVQNLKKWAREAETQGSVLPVGLTVYTRLNVDELWAKWLTGKWKYGEEGKQEIDYQIKGNGISLTFIFDTLQDRNHFKVSPQALFNEILVATLEGLGNDPRQLEDSLNMVLTGLFPNGIDKLEKPNLAEIDQVVENFYNVVRTRLDGIWEQIAENTTELKALYDDKNVKHVAHLLDQVVSENQQHMDNSYVLDADAKKFKSATYTHFNDQLKEISTYYKNDLYIIYFETNYVYNHTELGGLSDRIFKECRVASKDSLALIIVQTFKNDSVASWLEVTRMVAYSPSGDERLQSICDPSKVKSSDERIYTTLQQIIGQLYTSIEEVNKFEKLPVTSLVHLFNHTRDFVTTEDLGARGYGAYLGLNNVETTVDVPFIKMYTPSGIPIKPNNESTFFTYNAFQYISGISSGGIVYDAVYGLYDNERFNEQTNSFQSNPSITFLGFWSKQLSESLSQKEFIRLDEIWSVQAEGKYPIEGKDYVFATDGDWIYGGFLNIATCKIEYSEYQQFGEVAAKAEGPLRLSGAYRIPVKPDGAGPENYRIISTLDVTEDPSDLTCEIQQIYAQDGYGKVFLNRFMPSIPREDWDVMIEIALLYDNQDYTLIKEQTTRAREETLEGFYIGIWDRTITIQQDKTMEVLMGKITWTEYRDFITNSLTHFDGAVAKLQNMSDSDDIAEDILDYLTEYQLVNYVPYKDRLRLLKILADDGFGNEEDAAIKLIASFAINDKDRVQFVEDLQKPFAPPYAETLLEKLDEVFYDLPLIEGNSDNYHAFASLISSMATQEYFSQEKLEQRFAEDHPIKIVTFYKYDHSNWGYNVHKYDSEFSGSNQIQIQYTASFQFVKGFTGEVLNNLTLWGQVAHRLADYNGYEAKDTFHPLKDFLVVYIPGQGTRIFPAYYVKYLSSDKSVKRVDYYEQLIGQAAMVSISVASLGTATPLMVAVEVVTAASACVNISVVLLEDAEYLDPATSKLIKEVTMTVDLIGMGLSLPHIVRQIPDAIQSLQRLSGIVDFKPLILNTADAATAAKVEKAMVELKEEVNAVLKNVDEVGEVVSKWSKFVHISKLDATVLSKIDQWAEPLVTKLDNAIGKYPDLVGELRADLHLLEHFEGLHTNWYYRLGLARAHNVTGAGSINLPDNFAEVLKDLEISGGETLRSVFSRNNVSAELGNAFEHQLGVILENAWGVGVNGIRNADIPTDLRNYYEGIYNLGYTKIAQQVQIITPQGSNPIPDFMFFKFDDLDEALELTEVIYHDAKISTNSSYSSAQLQIKKTIEDAKNAGSQAQFTIGSLKPTDNAYILGLREGNIITIKEMSKVGTIVKNDLIDLVRKETIIN